MDARMCAFEGIDLFSGIFEAFIASGTAGDCSDPAQRPTARELYDLLVGCPPHDGYEEYRRDPLAAGGGCTSPSRSTSETTAVTTPDGLLTPRLQSFDPFPHCSPGSGNSSIAPACHQEGASSLSSSLARALSAFSSPGLLRVVHQIQQRMTHSGAGTNSAPAEQADPQEHGAALEAGQVRPRESPACCAAPAASAAAAPTALPS